MEQVHPESRARVQGQREHCLPLRAGCARVTVLLPASSATATQCRLICSLSATLFLRNGYPCDFPTAWGLLRAWGLSPSRASVTSATAAPLLQRPGKRQGADPSAHTDPICSRRQDSTSSHGTRLACQEQQLGRARLRRPGLRELRGAGEENGAEPCPAPAWRVRHWADAGRCAQRPAEKMATGIPHIPASDLGPQPCGPKP